MSVELDRNLKNKVIIKKRTQAGKSLRYIVVTCIGCNKQREVITWKWTSRGSDYCKNCFAKHVAAQSPAHIKHGLSTHPIYNAYHNMLRRCHDPTAHNYKYYGIRGIKVCDKWRDKDKGLQAFFSWSMANGWEKGLQLDRIDNDGNYEPDNVNYISQLENLKKMENLFGIEGRKVKCTELKSTPKKSKKNVSSPPESPTQKCELQVEPLDNLESFSKLDDYFPCC